jgi:hypothetical protein
LIFALTRIGAPGVNWIVVLALADVTASGSARIAGTGRARASGR